MKVEVGKEYVHRGQFVKILSIAELDESAYVRTRRVEESEVRISELQEKAPPQ